MTKFLLILSVRFASASNVRSVYQKFKYKRNVSNSNYIVTKDIFFNTFLKSIKLCALTANLRVQWTSYVGGVYKINGSAWDAILAIGGKVAIMMIRWTELWLPKTDHLQLVMCAIKPRKESFGTVRVVI
jgi:hypothetical protein